MTIGNYTGDGVVADLIDLDLTLPDSGTSIVISGRVQRVGQTIQAMTGSPLSAPVVPGSGYTGWIIQVDYTTGAASMKAASNAIPTPDANNMVVWTDKVNAGDNSSLVFGAADAASPDDW